MGSILNLPLELRDESVQIGGELYRDREQFRPHAGRRIFLAGNPAPDAARVDTERIAEIPRLPPLAEQRFGDRAQEFGRGHLGHFLTSHSRAWLNDISPAQ